MSGLRLFIAFAFAFCVGSSAYCFSDGNNTWGAVNAALALVNLANFVTISNK